MQEQQKHWPKISSCCKKDVYVDCGDEGTCCHICTSCRKPCDAINDEGLPKPDAIDAARLGEAKEEGVISKCTCGHAQDDMNIYGMHFCKNGKRIDPKNVEFQEPLQLTEEMLERQCQNLMEIIQEKDEALDQARKVINEKYNPHIEVFKLDEISGNYVAQHMHKIQKASGYIRIIIF